MEYCLEEFLSYKLHIIKTKKFKTVSVKVILSSPVVKEEITLKNFLGDILTYSSKKYSTQKKMAIELQELYAMNIFSSCYRIGKLYNMDIGASFLNEKYTEKGMLEESIKLLSELIFNPNVKNNSFDRDSFDIVKENTKNQIESMKEDTRKLSLIKMLEYMDKDKAYSYHGFGYLEDLNQITPKNLYEYYKKVIRSSKVDIFILGDVDINEVKKIVKSNFKFNTLKMKKHDLIINHEKIRKIPKKIIEEGVVSQSKLSIGCKIDELNDYERNYVLPMYSIILGGSSTSKLHQQVREQNSLCYYISASASKLDNILYITSGISYENFDKTLKLVREALKSMKNGDFTEEDLEKAKIQYITMLDELQENAFQIISSYYSIELLSYDDIQTRKEKIKSIKHEDVISISSKIHIDTVYLLKGDE